MTERSFPVPGSCPLSSHSLGFPELPRPGSIPGHVHRSIQVAVAIARRRRRGYRLYPIHSGRKLSYNLFESQNPKIDSMVCLGVKQTLAGTCSLAAASRQLWDVLVVGAGPSGSVAARQLAKGGATVLLVDKADFPRRKPCGCYLNRAALSVLEDIGLGQLTGRCQARIVNCVRLGANHRSAEIAVPPGAALSREVLDSALVDAAVNAGAEFLPRTAARLGESQADFRTVQLVRDKAKCSAQCRVVVVADGVAGRFLQDCNEVRFCVSPHSLLGASAMTNRIPQGYRAGTIQMAIGRLGYVGLLQIEDGRIDVAAAFPREELKRSTPGALAQRIVDQCGLPPLGGLADLRWLGTPPLTRSATVRAGHRFFLVGDASSYVEPFTGEGISWALATGSAVAPIVLQATHSYSPDLIRKWSKTYQRLLGRRQILCRFLAARLRHPRQVALAVTALSWAPFLASPVVRWLNSPLER